MNVYDTRLSSDTHNQNTSVWIQVNETIVTV